jgi:hypothetical protein
VRHNASLNHTLLQLRQWISGLVIMVVIMVVIVVMVVIVMMIMVMCSHTA